MQLLTILNRCEKHKCFVYKEARLMTGQKGDESIDMTIVSRANGSSLPASYSRLPIVAAILIAAID